MSFDFDTYTDRQGRIWNIPALLRSTLPRVRRIASAPELLDPLLDEERWGADGGTIRQALQLAARIGGCVSRPDPDDNSLNAHAHRIAGMVKAVSTGWAVAPLIVGLDATLWDGLHRLAALTLLGMREAAVDDFSPGGWAALGPVQPERLAALKTRISTTLLDPAALARMHAQFHAAPGYPRYQLSAVLDPDFAQECANAIRDLDWSRHTTDFFSQDEFVLAPGAEVVATTLNELGAVLLGADFLHLLCHITGNSLLENPDLVVHRMRPGDYVGVHNDFRQDGQRLRCVLYLGEPNPDIRHGAFVALGDGRGEQLLDVIPPRHNSAVLFEISRRSFHMVTEIEDQHRYCVVLSYHERGPTPTSSTTIGHPS